MTQPAKTPRALILWGADWFEKAGLVYGHGTDNALDEAASLVLHALDIGYNQPDAVLDTEISELDYARVAGLLEQRVTTRKPAAYLMDEAWFAGMPFYVDERVLVPRSPIAELIVARFAPWVDPDRVHSILDMGTGSGCIAIACAAAFPQAQVEAADVSRDALAVARINTARHGVGGRVNLIESDLFSALDGKSYDIIVSNPPYVSRDEAGQLADEYRHEPASGLIAGEDGLDIVVRLLNDAARYLVSDGILVVEVGYTHAALQAQYPEVPFIWLDFENGGTGVFLLEAARLAQYQETLKRVALQRKNG
ncbi:MAG: 50S ribosomal protein L3 N(5)-glutamine methyltransferase [Gammaproteobacteria bacterium]|nr:50S ribosomal protein L3 N(5)-glutamine methyltransferase [Gammaproteobacteria bacterium]